MSGKVRRALGLALALGLCGCGRGVREAPPPDAPAAAGVPAALPELSLGALRMDDPGLAPVDSLEAAGNHREAMRVAQRHLVSVVEQRGRGSDEAATAMVGLARLAHAQGDFAGAHRLDAEALAVRRRIHGERHPLVAQSLLQLAADIKNEGGRLPEALALCRQSLLLRRELLAPGSAGIGESLMGLANIHRAMNHPDSARAAFAEALRLRRALVPRDPDAIASTLTAYSLVYTQASDWRAAEPLLREAVLLRRGLAAPATGGLEMSLSTYGMTLRNLGRSAGAESVLTECAGLRERLRSRAVKGRGRAAMFDLSVYWQLAAAQLELDRGEQAWVSVERGMSRTLVETLHDHGAIDTLGMWRGALGRVQRDLAPDEAIIGWLELKRGAGREGFPMWCYCVRNRGPVRWHRVDGAGGDMWHGSTDALWSYKGELRAAAGWPLRLNDTAEVARLGRALYATRIAPLESDLVGARRLLVVSPDIMRGVPLAALTDTAGRWLGERFEISYTPSALLASLRHAHARAPRPAREWRGLLVGDPAYQGAVAWPRLSGSRAEVEAIGAMLPRATRLLGTDASQARLRELAASGALARYDLIHFATHAAIDERRPGRSALVLSESAGTVAAASDAPDVLAEADDFTARDGLMTVDEITRRWTLEARLVSLAACSSVMGPVSHVEGYIGFEQALLGAGAHALLVSLWHVDDAATALLMRRFYANLLGAAAPPMTSAAALREAQHWLRTLPGSAGSRPYAHPVYWAGIALVGDPD